MTQRLAIAALVVPALVLVALAARSYRPFADGEPAVARNPSTTFVDGVLTVTLVVAVVLALLGLWIRLPRRAGKAGRASPYAGLVVFLVIVFAATVMGRALLKYDRPSQQPEPTGDAFPAETRPGERASAKEASRAPQVIWPLAVGLAGLVLAAAVLLVVVQRRRSRAQALTQDELEELARTLDDAIEDLRSEPDPRRAVVAAYARMEQALSYYGLARRPSETPYEYLRRVARELDAEAPVAELTELFEEAKFSEHAVNEAMRGRAIDALVSVRAEVRVAAVA